MKPGWGIGTIVAILLSFALYLFGVLPDWGWLLSCILLLCGLWTVVAAFAVVESKDRTYYLGWGAVIAVLSLFRVVSLAYTIALILMAIVVLIIINVYLGRTPKMYNAATTAPPKGGTPAASAVRA